MDFTFSALQLPGLIVLAESRNTFKAGAKAKNRKIADTQSDFEVMLSGLMGEFAVAKTLDVAMDMSHRNGGDGGADMMFKQRKVQVKTSNTDMLIFNQDDRRLTADLCVLTQIMGPCRVRIHGWTTREEFYHRCRQYDFGYGMRDVLDCEKLKPIEDLINGGLDVDHAAAEIARAEMHVMKRRLERRVSG
jgi:hypothetical protein